MVARVGVVALATGAVGYRQKIQDEKWGVNLVPDGFEVSLLEANSSTGYFSGAESISLFRGGSFLGPVQNIRCAGHNRVDSTAGGDADSCAQMCEDRDCYVFSVSGGRCEFFGSCHGTMEADGNQLYVKNTLGMQKHSLPTTRQHSSSGNFMVLGDWGGSTSPNRDSMHYVHHRPPNSDLWVNDHFAQDNVARRMGEVGAQTNPFMVVNAGDNFYWGGINHWTKGGRGVHDWFWSVGFENMYSHPSLKVPWISIMGNHDYGGNGCFADMQAQFDYTTKDLLNNDRWKMPSPYYTHRIDFDGFSLELFMMDTNIEDSPPFARHGGICAQHLCPGGDEARTVNAEECVTWFEELWTIQTTWLAGALRDSTAEWKIIVGHHKPAGRSANLIRPLLEQHNVQMVIGSHTHEMAFFDNYSNIGRPLLVVGAGGGAEANPGCAGAHHCGGVYGFAGVGINSREMNVKIHEHTGDTPMDYYICQDGRVQSHSC